MQDHGPEKRQHLRYATAGLAGRLNFAPSRVVDLSFGGALVETHDWFGIGHRVTLRVAEPPLQLPGLVVRARLIRIDPVDGRPIYQAALRFEDAPGARQQLAGLIATLAAEPLEKAVPAYS